MEKTMENKEPWSTQRRRVKHLSLSVMLASLFCVACLYMLQARAQARADVGNFKKWAPGAAAMSAPQVAFPADHNSDLQLDIIAGSAFTFAVVTEALGLDPSLALDGNSLMVTSQVYETLIGYQPGGVIPEPGLAESWSVTPDGLTWTFRLRPGVKFHDGTDLDAEAVVYNLERWWDPAHPHHNGSFDYFGFMFGGFKGDPDCLISSLGTIGTDQVQISLREPHSPLLNTLAMPAFAIASPAAIQSGTLDSVPAGSGPFKFVEWMPGDYIRLTANTEYWGRGPHLETLTFQVIADGADRFAALQSNSVQGIQIFSGNHIPATTFVPTATLDTSLKVLWQPALNTGYLGINRGHSPLDNQLVRLAIAHAIDKQSIVGDHYNAEADVGQAATQFLPPLMWGHDQDMSDYNYDPDLARTILAQAGYTSGFTTTLWVLPVQRLYFPNPTDIATSIQIDLEAVGITPTLVTTYDFATYLNKIKNGEADLFMLGWVGDNGHPDNFLYYNLCDGDLYQGFGPRDDVLCDMLQVAREEHDFDTQVVIYEWASQRVHDTLPLVPIAHSRMPLIMRHDVVGFVPVPTSNWAESFRDVFFAKSWMFLPVIFK